jgi:flagellar assembly protein FliH
MPTVIKAGQSNAPTLRRLETIDLADHVVEASKIVNAARHEAEQLVTRARSAAGRIRQRAQETGYQEGYAKGEAQGRLNGHDQALAESTQRFNREQADLVSIMQSTVANLESLKRDLLIQAEHDVLAFAVRVAEKVAKRAVALDRDAAVNNLKAVLRLVGTRTDLVVRIHPTDGDTMRQFAATLAEDLGQRVHVRVTEDETLTPGGCVVRTGVTEVDAAVDTQIDQIVNLVLSKDGRAGESRV